MSIKSIFKSARGVGDEQAHRALEGFRSPPPKSTVSAAPYVMAKVSDDEAEIVLYGDIVSRQPTDWFGEPVEGNFIILSEFLDDLKAVEDVSRLTIRIHSVGGDSYTSMAIHNRLKEIKAHKTVRVDGVAMSGGSLIMCAGDTVQINAGALVMIHESWCFMFGGYSASELRKISAGNEAVDRVQAAIYHKKTGIAENELLSMMAAETYMTGSEAVEKGFADELIDNTAKPAIAASADRRTLYFDGSPVWAAPASGVLPASLNIPTISPAHAAEINKPIPGIAGKTEGGTEPMAKTIEELRAAYPELTAQIAADAKAAVVPADNKAEAKAAVEAERNRLKEIDDVSVLYSADLVQAAKYGENACTAQELTYRAAIAAAKQGQKALAGMEADTQASGAQQVGALPGTDNKANTPEQRMADARSEVKSLLGKQEE